MIAVGLRFLALLALASGLLAVSMAVPPVRRSLADVRTTLAAAVAATAMLGSLWLSEVVGLLPCRLCWFQRAAMYPLAVLLTVLVVRRRDRLAAGVGVPVAVVGASVSAWHLVVQARPSLEAFCELDNPCSTALVRQFGFLTIPGMALIGFLTIAALLLPTLLERPALQHRT